MVFKKDRLLGFDLDGTILDSADAIADCASRVLIEAGIQNASYQRIKETIGRPIKEVFTDLIGDEIRADYLSQEFRNLLALEGHLKTQIFPGILETFDLLLTRNIKIAIATNKNTWLAEKVILDMQINKYFIKIVGQDKAKPKPSPAMLNKIISDLNVEMIAFCGDTEDDIKAAQAANVDAIAIAHGNKEFAKLQTSNPTYLVQSTSELPDLITQII